MIFNQSETVFVTKHSIHPNGDHHRLKIIVISIIIVASFLKQVASEAGCPKNFSINPCRCSSNKTIVCDGEYEFNLKGIFQKLSKNIQEKYATNHIENIDDISVDDGDGNHFESNSTTNASIQIAADIFDFDEFVLNNTDIAEIDDDAFGTLSFKRIKLIDCLSLRRIKSNAFRKKSYRIEEFVVSGESSLGEDRYASELFDALNSMVNVEKILLNRNRLRSIPTVAFGKKPEKQFRLKELNFNGFSSKNGHIKTVGNFAFYYLNELQYLYLSHQRINFLPMNAFDFEQSSNKTLYIYLGNNKLNSSSFEQGIFLNSKRPIHLELYWNPDLTYLDENVFKPFLFANEQNRITLQDNPLICDCRSYWLFRDRHILSKRIQNVLCKIGPKQTFPIDLISFNKCSKSSHRTDSNSDDHNDSNIGSNRLGRRRKNKIIVVN
ncbi:hypothetical protein NH340_JMT03203 [Sarcoptes scabiei]|nr:hypothetical protein NH340_JMT03203 [Sarcoptes scabiei]